MSESTYYELCAELVKIEDAMNSGNSLMSNQGQALDGFSALANFRDVANRARASLAQMGAEGPSDEELDEFAHDYWWLENNHSKPWRPFARAILTRYNISAPQPIPVSERTPEVSDCDEKGRCWVGCPSFVEDDDFGTITYNPSWELCTFTQGDTHWLPYWALPIPTTDTKE
jgi:hypothetical protein